ncbi:FAD-dependent monooxygenase [Mycobacterium sp.]|uniref:FAD-dependent monooxygenase n=1 Tax=Mycobacterium sp. TaxID=1785 RepID=UPI002CBB46C9|nr:FAD-dependent monooxygenase [Mycobacterium sp.]HTQ19952.1 FAD-dependent monooxygenase [Mycobacterium sp.]
MDTQVLITGAGPTGLTLAIELARRGIDVRVVDKAERFAIGSRADGLQPRTLEVFEDLGVLDRIFAAGMGAPVMRIYDGDAVVWEQQMARPEPPQADVPYPNLCFVPQWRTEEILRARLSEHGVHVQLDAEVIGVTQDDDAVAARLDSGETLRAAYLIGADGGRSTVRRQLEIQFLGTTDDDVQMVLADVRVEGLDHDYGHGWMLDGHCFFGFTPLAGGGDAFVVNTTAPGLQPTLPALQAVVDTASGRTDIRLRELTWATTWRANARLAQRFRQGRTFLAGDAAHVHPPTGGQGLNTGVQDAYNLGWKLAAVLAGASDELLDSYQAERLPIASRVLGISTELLDKTLRGSDDALERGTETRQLGLNYRGGPLTLDDGCSATLAAGDRAPDAPCRHGDGRSVRLFTLFAGPHWTLLRFGPDAPHLDHQCVHSHQVGADILDADRQIHQAYDVSDGAAVLVRPDGYIGAITMQPAALTGYANRVLPRDCAHRDRNCTGPRQVAQYPAG